MVQWVESDDSTLREISDRFGRKKGGLGPRNSPGHQQIWDGRVIPKELYTRVRQIVGWVRCAVEEQCWGIIVTNARRVYHIEGSCRGTFPMLRSSRLPA